MTGSPSSGPAEVPKPSRTERQEILYGLVKEFFQKPVTEDTKKEIKEKLRLYGYKSIGVDVEESEIIIVADGAVIHECTNPYDDRDQT